jgi:hypothetical protein
MNQQRVGQDFFSARLETDVPKRMVPTVTFTARQCPVCLKWARILVRPPFNELQSEICVDFCEGDKKYPSAYVNFRGSWLKDGNAVVETLKGADGKDGTDGAPGGDGKDGAPGRDAPSREELRAILQELLAEERANRFWTKLFSRLRRRA